MKELSAGKQGAARNPKLPPFLCSSLIEVLQELEVEILFAGGEGDAICVELAVERNGYILSQGTSCVISEACATILTDLRRLRFRLLRVPCDFPW